MDKIKNVFSPGHSKDDEIMYGTPEKASKSSNDTPSNLTQDPEREHGQGGLLGQTGGATYPDQSHGNAAAVRDDTRDYRQAENNPETEKKSGGLLQKILHPGGQKDSDQGYGTSAGAADETRQHGYDSTHQQGYDDTRQHGYDDTRQHGYDDTRQRGYDNTTAARDHSYPAESSYANRAVDNNPQSESHYGRDAALVGGAGAAGAGAAGAGALAYGSHSHQQQENTSNAAYTDRSHPVGRSDGQQDDVSRATYTERSYPVGGGSSTNTTAGQSSSAPYSTSASAQDSHFGRDAAIAGGGAGVLGTGAMAASHSSNRAVDPSTSAYENQSSQQYGRNPSIVPHVPGAFPRDESRDPHMPGAYPYTPSELTDDEGKEFSRGGGAGTAAGLGAGATGAAGLAGYEASKSSSNQRAPEPDYHSGGKTYQVGPSTTTTTTTTMSTSGPTTTQSHETHYGRDAAIAGGATAATGAAGAAAYETTDRHDTGPASKTSGPHNTTIANILDPRVKNSSPQSSSQRQGDETHYGRDAAVVGGVGAAGAGAYELSKDRDDDYAKEQERHQKDVEKREREQQKEADRQAKEQDRQAKEQQKEHERHQKEVEKREREQQKEADKADKERKKQAEKQAKEDAAIAKQRDKDRQREIEQHEKEEAAFAKQRERDEAEAAKLREKEESRRQEDDSHLGRDAAIAGGAGVGAAGIGAGAYEHYQDRDEESRSPNTLANKIATDQAGHKHLHKKSVESPGEKKPGFISKLLHRNKDKTATKEGEYTPPQSPQSPQSSQSPSGAYGGAYGGGYEGASREAGPSQGSSTNRTGLPLDDRGMITISRADADPNAPALVVKEKAGGGYETVPR